MDFFVPNAEVDTLLHQLGMQEGLTRLHSLIRLAWRMRQRDCERALALCLEAEALMEKLASEPQLRNRYNARIALIQGEVSMLYGRLSDAEQLIQTALQEFRSLDDSIGAGDAYWALASISAAAGGSYREAMRQLPEALTLYRIAGDAQRVQATLARQQVYAAYLDPLAAKAVLDVEFPVVRALDPAVCVWVDSARANVAALTDDPTQSIKHDLAAYRAGMASGQVVQALFSIINASESFALLGDLDAALEWSAQALALVRPTRWPVANANALMQHGDVMRMLGRHEEARSHLQEALTLSESVGRSRIYQQVIERLGQLAMATGDFVAALAWFERFEAEVVPRQEADLIIKAWNGQAGALQGLGRLDVAQAKAQAALALARERGHIEGQVRALSLLARNVPAGQPPSLPHLEQALQAARGIAGYTIEPELLLDAASAYAAQQRFEEAYRHALQALAARDQTRSQEAHSRVLSLQVRQDIERARTDAESHRLVAENLRETAATLQTLGTIGLEITGSLNAQQVFETLHRHVDELLEVTSFAIYLIDEEHKNLVPSFAVEADKPVQLRPIALSNPTSKSARCARKRQEIVVNTDPPKRDPNLVPGTLITRSLMFFPLLVGQRLMGVMTIQSERRDAYGEREQAVFRTLCAYGAIALDNAAAYGAAERAQQRADQALTELRAIQGQLIEQNAQLARLAVTDQLTGLYNRLQLDRALEEEHSRNMRYGTQFCVLLMDVDQFKLVNDTFGHQTGDEVLVGIAQVLRDGIREVDVAGRWGGEEFLIICRETGLAGALVLAEKLRLAIERLSIHPVGSVSASFGVAEFHSGELLTEMLSRADAALYRAKHAGRNRVESGEGAGTLDLGLQAP